MVTLPRLRMVVLGSGSAGNAIAVTDGETTALVDCGFSAREVSRRLAAAGIPPNSVDAILVTHEHGDHVAGIEVFCRRHAPHCRVHATAGTWHASRLAPRIADQMTVRSGDVVRVGTLTVTPFATSHDAAEPVGFRIESGDCSVGIITDSGVLTDEARETLVGCTFLGIESNHDVRMLEHGPYPIYLKRRIASASGHLSNDAAVEALEQLAHDSLEQVFALHRSRTNNTDDLVADALGARIALLGLPARVSVAKQSLACDSHPPQRSLFAE